MLLLIVLLLAMAGSAFAAGAPDKTGQPFQTRAQTRAQVQELTGVLEGSFESGFKLALDGGKEVTLKPNNPAVNAKLIVFSRQKDLGEITVRGVYTSEKKTEMVVLSLKGGILKQLGQTVSDEVYRAGNDFQDIGPGHGWAANAIRSMFRHKILAGMGDNKFNPDALVTRAQFAKILVKTMGTELINPEEPTFADVQKDFWAYQFVETAAEEGWLTGYDINDKLYFKPHFPAVREDMAVAIVKALDLDLLSESEADDVLDDFKDADKISKELRVYVATAVYNELMQGYEDGTFRPLGTLTRAEAAVLMFRVLQTFKIVVE